MGGALARPLPDELGRLRRARLLGRRLLTEARPAYALLAGPDGDRAVPATGVAVAVRLAAGRALGRSGFFGGAVGRAYARLRSDPRARSVSFAFAEARLGPRLVVSVDPSRLVRFLPDVLTDGTWAVRLAHRFLDAGDWSGALRPLGGGEVDEEVAALFDHDGALDRSPAFARLLARAEEGRPEIRNGVALDGRDRIAAYFDHYRRLRDSVARHGVTAREAVPAEVGAAFARSSMRGRGAERREREPGLAIDASGELVRMVGGRHRTAIAQRLGLARMPAQVRLVHVDWLAGRVAATGEPPERALLVSLAAISDREAPDA